MAEAVKPFNVHYDVDLIAQPNEMSCWSAAATMVLGGNMSVGPGKASLDDKGGLYPDPQNVKQFADQYGLVVEYGATFTATGLARLLRMYGPLWVGGKAKAQNRHAYVISGIEGTSDKDAVVTINDPWPPKGAKEGGTFYPAFPLELLYQTYPESTEYILHKTSPGQDVYPSRLPWAGQRK